MKIFPKICTFTAIGFFFLTLVPPALAGGVNVTGIIKAVTADSITVRDTTFALTDETAYKHGSSGDLAVDVRVKVRGEIVGGVLTATEIKFLGKNGGGGNKGERVVAEGLIDVLTETEITVGGTTFAITANTRVARGSFDDLAVGVEVEVRGRALGDGTVEALQIKLARNNGDGSHGPRTAVTGVVTAIDAGEGDTLIVTLDGELTLEVDGNTRLFGRHGLRARASDLVVGLTLRVLYHPYGEFVSTGPSGRVAVLMILGRENIRGTVEAVSAPDDLGLGSITVSSMIFYFDDLTRVIGASEGVNDPADLPIETPVAVLCNPLADGSYLANKVIANNASGGGPNRDSGLITGLTNGSGSVTGFSIGGQEYLIDENTSFMVAGYDGPFSADELVVDLLVIVKWRADADGNRVAVWVRAVWVRVVLPVYKYCAEIEAVGTDSITLLGLVINVTEWTEFSGFPSPDTTLADLLPGDKVEVKVLLWPDGTLVAAEIEPCDDDTVHVRGEITSITPTSDGAALVVAGVDVVATSDTEVSGRDGALSLSDLTEGMTVDVWGELDAGGVLQAERIRVR